MHFCLKRRVSASVIAIANSLGTPFVLSLSKHINAGIASAICTALRQAQDDREYADIRHSDNESPTATSAPSIPSLS